MTLRVLGITHITSTPRASKKELAERACSTDYYISQDYVHTLDS